MLRTAVVLCCATWTCLTAEAQDRRDERRNCDPPFSLGLRIVSLPGGPETAIWYPTDDRESPYSYTKDTFSQLALNGAPSHCGSFPAIVFSHGFGGCGIQSLFLTEALARHGYVVAAPDHRDALCRIRGSGFPKPKTMEASFFKPETWTQDTFRGRATDIRKVLDWLAENREFRDVVDARHTGAVGHSLGGYTVLGLAGGWRSWKDDRIRAVLALSPYSLPFQNKGTMKDIDVPVMYQGAQFDIGITPFVRGAKGAYGLTKSPKYYVELRGGNHFEWTNLLCLGERSVIRCTEKRVGARTINSFAERFFDRYLKIDRDAMRPLSRSGVAAYQFDAADNSIRQ